MDNQILLPLVLFCGAPLEGERGRESCAKASEENRCHEREKKCRDVYGPPSCYTPTLPTAFVKL